MPLIAGVKLGPYDNGTQGGTDFLVLEDLEGETLAHRQGVIHRDPKPGNNRLAKAAARQLL